MVRAFLRSGEEAVIPHPSFVVYPMIVQAVGGIRGVVTLKDQRLDLEAMARAITPMTKMVFIANPNNPTPPIATADEGQHFMAPVPDHAPSRANFILVDVGRSASEVFHWLLKEGVIVRPMTSFGMESALRVTIGTPEENRRFVKALKKVLAGAKGA